MKKFLFLLVFLPIFAYSADISSIVGSLVDQLAADYTSQAGQTFYSKQTVSIIEIRNTTRKMEENYIGQGVEELVKNALVDSLVFKLVDRKNLDAALKEVKLSLTGLTDGKDAPELGKIRGVKLLLDGSVTAEGNSFLISLRLTSVETTEVVSAATAAVPKDALLAESSKIAYEYVTANGIGLSFFLTPTRYLVLNQSPPQEVGDGKTYAGAGGMNLTYRLSRNWKFSIDTDMNMKDVFYDYRKIVDMENLTAYGIGSGDVFEASNGLDIVGFWKSDGSLDTNGISTKLDVKNKLDDMGNYYTLTQRTTNVSFVLSYVYNFSRNFNVSAGIGPHMNFLRYIQTYDNVPILINEGVAFKRYEINMDFIGLGGTVNINLEYFVLPRFALNFGISGFYSYIFPKSNNNLNAYSPTTGEYYYGSGDYSLESFGLNPFMMPDGRSVLDVALYPANYIKASIGASIYF